MLWCGDTWLLRNRFERSEEKARRRTASGKTIAIPASDPGIIIVIIIVVVIVIAIVSGKTIAIPALGEADSGIVIV